MPNLNLSAPISNYAGQAPLDSANVTAAETITIDGVVYTWDGVNPQDPAVGIDLAASVANIATKINAYALANSKKYFVLYGPFYPTPGLYLALTKEEATQENIDIMQDRFDTGNYGAFGLDYIDLSGNLPTLAGSTDIWVKSQGHAGGGNSSRGSFVLDADTITFSAVYGLYIGIPFSISGFNIQVQRPVGGGMFQIVSTTAMFSVYNDPTNNIYYLLVIDSGLSGLMADDILIYYVWDD